MRIGMVILFILLVDRGISQVIVVDHATQQPLPLTHITFNQLSTGKQTFVLCDSEGTANNPFADLTAVHISYMGYENIYDTIVGNTQQKYELVKAIFTINDFVVTAQYAPTSPEKSVYSIKIIDQKRIQEQGANSLKDVLTNELNVRLSQDNILGSGMEIGGISGQNVKILIDGVPVVGRLNGNIDLSQINLNNIERIEVVEGPLSVNYGTNALGGTINLITKKAADEKWAIAGNTYYETVGHYNFDGSYSQNIGKSKLMLDGGRYFFGGWAEEDTGRFKSWKPKEQYFGGLKCTTPIKQFTLTAKSDYYLEKITNRGMPRLPYYETAFDDYYFTNRSSNHLQLSGDIGAKAKLDVIGAFNYYQRIKNTFYKDLTTLEEELTTNAGDQDTSVFKLYLLRGNYSIVKDSSKLNYQLGWDINRETAEGKRILDQQQAISDYAAFASAEYHPKENITIKPALRAAYNTKYNAPLVPSLNIRMHLNNKLTVRASYARGFRAPSLKELYLYFVDINHNISGNKELQAEHSDNFNLSISYSRFKEMRAIKISLGTFFNNIYNQISLAQSSSSSYRYFNVDRFQSFGTQLNTEVKVNHLSLNIGGSYTARLNPYASSRIFGYTPELRTNAKYEFKKQQMSVNVFYKYNGEVPIFISNSDQIETGKIAAYHACDFSITKRFKESRVVWGIGCKNLFNVTNIQAATAGGAHSSSDGTASVGYGRSIFTSLKLNLHGKS